MNRNISIPGSSTKPRLGIDVTSALSQHAGIGRYTRELIRTLVRSNDSFDYTLFSAKIPRARELIPDEFREKEEVRIRTAPISEKWLYRLWHRLRVPVPVQWFTGELDLYYSPDFVLPPVAGSIPTILTVHDLSFVHFPETFTPSLITYLNEVVPRSVRKASHILADSEATKVDLVNIWEIPDKKISVLYSGVDRSFRPVTDKGHLSSMREKYGLGQDPYILSVSTIQPRKNYQMLIRAFKRIASDYPHRLVIAGGKGWLFESILEEVRIQNLEDKVLFIGFVDDDDLPALYSDATLFVFPSLYEGFGLPLLEAMACGVPVISSSASCLPEVAGEAALTLPPEDERAWTGGIQGLLDDPNRRMKMVASGFRRSREFTWWQSADTLADTISGLLEG
jgi:glycosyltransferase involved in cell wall biosynthesis